LSVTVNIFGFSVSRKFNFAFYYLYIKKFADIQKAASRVPVPAVLARCCLPQLISPSVLDP
jgi:hypothetical protein